MKELLALLDHHNSPYSLTSLEHSQQMLARKQKAESYTVGFLGHLRHPDPKIEHYNRLLQNKNHEEAIIYYLFFQNTFSSLILLRNQVKSQ